MRERWRSVALIWLGVIGLVMWITSLVPKQYTAAAAVVVDVKAPELFNSQASFNPSWVPGYIATQVDVLRSERVALHAMRKLGMDQDPEWRKRWLDKTDGQGDFPGWLAYEVSRKLDVKASREGSAIYVAYTGRTPESAAQVANAIVQGYIDTSRELRLEPVREFASFFDERASKLRGDLEAAQARLSAYQQKTGILARDERLDVENTRLNELNTQLVQVQSLAAESSGKRAQAVADPTRSLDVMSNALVAGLNADIFRQQARLEDLSGRLGERHPEVMDARASLEGLRERLAGVTRQISGGVQASDSVSRARVAKLEDAIAQQRTLVLRMKAQRDEIEVLIRSVENAQKAYDMVLARGSQTALESQSNQTTASVLKKATAPADPSSPRPLLNLVAAFVVGFFLALAYVLVQESRNRKLRRPDEALTELQLSVFGELPDMAGKSRGRGPEVALPWSAR